MVDSINNNSSINSLLRAQQTASIPALKPGAQASQAIINQLQRTAVVPAKTSSVTQTSKAVGPQTSLPRGSLVDKLV